jgi:DNA-binding beta-propeller fold protein YncE
VRRLSVGADGTLALDPSGDLAHAQTSGVVVHPGGQQLFLLGPYGIDAYDVAANGALTPSAGGSALLPPAAAGAVLSRLAVDPKGQFAYATANDYTNHRSWLVPYALGADGSIAPMGSATWAPGWSNVNFGSVEVVIEPSGRFAYAMPDGGAPWPNSFLAQYLVGADGAPSMLPGAPTVGGGHCPAHLAADPTGQFVVIANAAGSPSPGSQADGQVVWQTIGSDGSLVWQGSVPTGMYAQSVVLVAR